MKGQTFIIGIVVPDIVNAFFAELAHGVMDTAWDSGYKALLCETAGGPQREEAALQLLKETRTDGVIICETSLSDDALREWTRIYPAVVMFNHPLPASMAGSIRVNSVEGMHQAIQHLVAIGKKHLGFLAAGSSSFSHREQTEGFLQAADQFLVGVDQHVVCASNWEGGYMTTRNLLQAHPEIDGLICHNDLVATGALHACVGLEKRVPGDVAIVGCNDVLLARVTRPALTTLHVPKYEIGAMAVRLLLERIEGCRAQDEVVITQKLVVRASAP